MESEYSILIGPVVTEKATRLASFNQYVFKVAPWANKIQVKEAVQKIYKVKVENVRTSMCRGKRKLRKGHWVRRPAYKRAVVTLVKGTQIDPAALT